MWFLYDLFFFIGLLFYLPYALIKRKIHSSLWLRLGAWPAELKAKLSSQKKIWIHAVSVGEVLAVVPLVEKIREEFSGLPLVISTVTRTGQELAEKNFGKFATIIYAPMDFSFVVRRYIRWINPQIYITVETEIWPNLFYALNAQKVPTVVVNGRISDKTFPRYSRFRLFWRPVLKRVSKFCVQSKFDAQRIIYLGGDPAKVEVVGNVKFDDLAAPASPVQHNVVVNENELVWVAGSTHPGEEEIILNTYQSLQKKFPALRLILVPRHIERAKEVRQLVFSKGYQGWMYSDCRQDSLLGNAVIIVDEIGHLRYLYQLATIVFVGKSLTARGGQNMIEPALYSKPVIVGPYTENFKNVMAELLEVKGIVQIKDSAELLIQMNILLADASLRQSIGLAAKELAEKNKGVTAKTFQSIKPLFSV